MAQNQRLPINSRVHPGKWFLHLDSDNTLSLVLAFPNCDENLIERFLSKTANALKEAQQLLPDRERFICHLDEKVKKYGLHCLRDQNNLNSLSKIEFSESLFQESQISNEIPEILTPPVEIINQIESPQIEKTPLEAPLETASRPLVPIEQVPNESSPPENFDFFEFDAEKPSPEEAPTESNQIVITDACSTVVPAPVSVPQSSLKALASKPVRIRFARYVLAVFTVLMFLFILKMFSELGSTSEEASPNHVRFTSSHRHRHRA